jgi:hypothetical protein
MNQFIKAVGQIIIHNWAAFKILLVQGLFLIFNKCNNFYNKGRIITK